MKKTQFWWYLTGKLDMLFNENASASEILKNLSWENHVYIYIYLLYLQHLQLDCNLFFSTFLVAYKKPLTVGYLHCRPSTNYLRPSEPWIEGSHEQCWDVAGRSSKTFVTLHSWLETNSKVLNTISIYCIYNIYIYICEHSVWRRMTSATTTSNMYRCFGRYTESIFDWPPSFTHSASSLTRRKAAAVSSGCLQSTSKVLPKSMAGNSGWPFSRQIFHSKFGADLYLLVKVELSSTLLEKTW